MEEDIRQLRALIRELGLTWLDEELEATISAGKLREKEVTHFGKKSVRGMEQVPYSAAEQLDLILTAIRNYFVVLPQVQQNALRTIQESLNVSVDSEAVLDIEPALLPISVDIEKLNSLLNQVQQR